MSKFNPNVFKGSRTRVALVGYPGVSRWWIWDKQKQRYVEPKRGDCYFARRGGKSRVSKSFATRDEAINWVRGIDVQVPIQGQGYCVRELLNDWQRHAWPTFREGTRIFYAKVIQLFEPLYDVEVESLHPKMIDEWLSILKGPKYQHRIIASRKSFAKELETLKSVLNWYRERNDDTKLVMPIKKRHNQMAVLREVPRKHSSYMTDTEYEKWLIALREDHPLFFAMALIQTRQLLRVSEVCAMKWSNLDLANRTYRLCEHVIWPRVNGQPPEIIPGTKNMRAGEVHHLPLRQDVTNLLREMEKGATHDLIFHDQGNILSYRQVQYRYNVAFKKAGLPFSSTHIARHTGATAFLNETGDYLALQQMGNWADLKVALHYGKVLGSRAKEAVAKAEKPKLKLVSEGAI